MIKVFNRKIVKTMRDLLLFQIAISCATQPVTEINTKLSENEGIVIGTISVKDDYFIKDGYHFFYKDAIAENSKFKGKVSIKPTQSFSLKLKPDFYDGKNAIYIFRIKENAGSYYFYTAQTKDAIPIGTMIENQTFNLPFNVERGKVKYIGELSLNNIPLYENNGYRLINKSIRDIPFLKSKFPNLNIE